MALLLSEEKLPDNTEAHADDFGLIRALLNPVVLVSMLSTAGAIALVIWNLV